MPTYDEMREEGRQDRIRNAYATLLSVATHHKRPLSDVIQEAKALHEKKEAQWKAKVREQDIKEADCKRRTGHHMGEAVRSGFDSFTITCKLCGYKEVF